MRTSKPELLRYKKGLNVPVKEIMKIVEAVVSPIVLVVVIVTGLDKLVNWLVIMGYTGN